MKKQELFFRGGCEYSRLTELLYLGEIADEAEKKRAQLHLQQCGRCKRLYQELEQQYKFISSELQKPISNKTLDLVKKLSDKETKYGLVVCEPIAQEKNSTKDIPYHTTVLFTANGKGTTSKTLSDFKMDGLPENSIAIRTMTDKKQNKLLLYLWSPQQDDFEGWEIEIAGEAEKAKFTRSGMSQIPLIEIEDLNGKVIYFKEGPNAFASENRYAEPKKPIETL